MVYVEFIDQIGEPMIGPEAKSTRKFKRFDMRKGAGRTYHWNLKRGKLNSVEKKRRYFVAGNRGFFYANQRQLDMIGAL